MCPRASAASRSLRHVDVQELDVALPAQLGELGPSGRNPGRVGARDVLEAAEEVEPAIALGEQRLERVRGGVAPRQPGEQRPGSTVEPIERIHPAGRGTRAVRQTSTSAAVLARRTLPLDRLARQK